MSVTIANPTSNLSGATVVLIAGTHTITGSWTFDRDPSAPFAVTSGSAVVTNLDADKVDGLHAVSFLLTTGGTLTGNLLFSADNTLDIGASGATRPRDAYLGRNLAVGGTIVAVGIITQAAGGSTETFAGAGVINTDSTPGATGANTNDTAIFSYTLPANALNANGRIVKIMAWGAFGADGNNKTLRLKWNGIGGTTVVSLTTAANASKWMIQGWIIRTGSNAQDLVGFLPIDAGATSTTPANGTAAVTDSGAIDIVISAQNGSAVASDVTYEGSIIEFLN